MNRNKKIILVLVILIVGVIAGILIVKNKNKKYETASLSTYFPTITKEAKGKTVNFYGWGGNENLNKWIDKTLAPELKSKYDITLKRVPMDIEQILSKLADEKQAGKKDGSIDMIWINGENFYSAKENNLLYGPFTENLPNYNKYIDKKSDKAKLDFGYPIEGYEAPYSDAQMVLINDQAKTKEMPKNTDELMEFAKKYKGKVTYPAPPDFTGSAFVRNIIYDRVGYEQFFDMKADKETVKKEIQPAIDYMRELNKYLWKEGKAFPATSGQLESMFSDGELYLIINYEPFAAAINIEKGIYPKTARSFIFDKGTIGNTNYIAIANNSPNKEGAMVVINEVLSPNMQLTKLEDVKLLPTIDVDLLKTKEKNAFDDLKIGKGVLTTEELAPKCLPEIPAKFVPIIEEIWKEEVANK